MSFNIGIPNAHHRSAEQQQEVREARRLLKERTRNDWDYPPLPKFQKPSQPKSSDGNDDDDESESEEKIAGFKFHHASNHNRDALSSITPGDLHFEPLEWRERDYSSEESSENESIATSSSHGSKKSTYKFDGPDSVGAQISDRKLARKRKRQRLLDEEVTWNDGLAHWMARRDVWCCAHTSAQVHILESRKEEPIASNSASATSTPRTSYSSASASNSEPISSPSTTPELTTEEPPLIATQPAAPPSDILVPLAPAILSNHPVRRKITPAIYPEIYSKIILQSRTPSVPINLATLIKALVQGWKEDGEWPPKQGPVEKSIGRKKSSAHDSSLKNGVKAVGRVLRITSGESSVGKGVRDKG